MPLYNVDMRRLVSCQRAQEWAICRHPCISAVSSHATQVPHPRPLDRGLRDDPPHAAINLWDGPGCATRLNRWQMENRQRSLSLGAYRYMYRTASLMPFACAVLRCPEHSDDTMAGKRQALKRRDSPDNDALVANYGEPSFLWKQAFVIATIVLSPSIGFCWRLILISLLFTYFYCLFMVHSFHPPDDRRVFSLDMARFIATTISQVVVLIGLVAWCISITPIHIFAPTFMDVWTPYAVHDALRMAEVMHDAGDEAAVE